MKISRMTMIFGAVVIVAAMVHGPEAHAQTRRAGLGGVPPLGIGFQVEAVVLDMQDEAGSTTSAPTYTVTDVFEPGIYSDEASAAARAKTIAAEGIQAGQVFYPANVVRRVVIFHLQP